MTTVPCNGCTACCEHDLLFLHPEMGDRVEDYETELHVNPLTGRMQPALKHKPNGNCIYMAPHGCSIHERAPAICREFDCRRWFTMMSRPERRRLLKAGLITADMLDAARARLHTLKEEVR